jgi:metal-dependent amidase/aminoacylase/carboxypeptidase family protein
MAILAAVGEALGENRPRTGRVALLFQPSEEDGSGAARVISDRRLHEMAPDFVFALHNLPGFPVGEIVVRSGPFCCASRGMVVTLEGTTAHAAQPETGTSPAAAMCRIIELLGDTPARMKLRGEVAFATVVGARLGRDDAFGTAPGNAHVLATMRAENDTTLDRMAEQSAAAIQALAENEGVSVEIAWRDEFMATVNSAEAVEIIRRAAGDHPVRLLDEPLRWSEDFGRFTSICTGALFGIGAGEEIPDLHNPDYDFPDELIPIGAGVLERIVRECLG